MIALNGILAPSGGGGGAGDIVGPASSTDNAIARYDGTTGKLLQDSAVTVADTTGAMVLPAAGSIAIGGSGSYGAITVGSISVTGNGVDYPRIYMSGGAGIQPVDLNVEGQLRWSNSYDATATKDTGLVRSAAGVVKVTDGSTGFGALQVIEDPGTGHASIVFGSIGASTAGLVGGSNATVTVVTGNRVGYGTMDAKEYKIQGANILRGQDYVNSGGTSFVAQRGIGYFEAVTAGVGSPRVLDWYEVGGNSYTNEGATAKAYITLPSAYTGARATFHTQDVDGLRITANTGDTIRIHNNVTAAAGYIESTVIGSVVTLVAINATEWIATEVGGTWTDGTFTWSDIFPMGEISYFNTTGTAITISGTSDGSTNMVVINPTTALAAMSTQFDNGGGNTGRLRYTGTGTKMFHIAATVSGTAATANDVFVFGVAKGGTVLAESKVLGSSGGTQFSSLHAFASLATNEYLELYIGNTSGARNFTVKTLNLFAMGMT